MYIFDSWITRLESYIICESLRFAFQVSKSEVRCKKVIQRAKRKALCSLFLEGHIKIWPLDPLSRVSRKFSFQVTNGSWDLDFIRWDNIEDVLFSLDVTDLALPIVVTYEQGKIVIATNTPLLCQMEPKTEDSHHKKRWSPLQPYGSSADLWKNWPHEMFSYWLVVNRF